ncbi:MAG: ISKra4 family transposase [Methyloceanibacter sp.]
MTACAAALKPTQADAYLSAQEQYDSIITHLRSAQAQRMTHSELEQFLDLDGRELLRLMLQAHLDERGPGAVTEPVLDAIGQPHTHQRFHSRSIKTIFGAVTITRQGYGGRELESLHPLDAELNLPPENYSHPLQRRLAEAAAKESYDEVLTTISNQTGVRVPKRQAEESIRRSAQAFELFYQEQRAQGAREVKATSQILVMTADGKGVPMLKADLREATRKAAEELRPRLDHHVAVDKKSHTKRMGTVAAVYTIAPFVRTPEEIVRELSPVHEAQPARPRPEDKRVWASVKHPPETIIHEAFEEARRRDPKQTKQWVALVDGNQTQLGLLLVAAEDYGVGLALILDLIHVLEYLWKAARALHAEGDRAAEVWVRKRLAEILRGHSSRVAAGMTRSATLRGLSTLERAPIDACAGYLLKYREFLRYDQYLAAGYPIATGVIEGACRYLVKDRMEITGARWSLEGAEAVLRLRSLRASGDFDEYWKFHLRQEYKRNHQARYEKGQVPLPNPAPESKPKASRLRLVK